jgi:hypothetical protein
VVLKHDVSGKDTYEILRDYLVSSISNSHRSALR